MERELMIGDDVLIRIRPGLDPRQFGSGWRSGIVTDIGIDALEAERLISLSDGGPNIYVSHVDRIKWLSREPARHDGR